MAVRQIAKSSLNFSNDTTFIEFPRSDGDQSQWPSNTTKVVDKDGTVNYMSPQSIDLAPSPVWRRNSGMAIAKALNMDGANDGRSYVLKDFPKGYGMFIHLKGPEKRPRSDPYLYGSTHVLKFRSSNEFTPHGIWLFTDETLNHSNCQCKYSTKKPQLHISQSMGLSTRGGSPSATSGLRSSRVGRPKREVRAKTVTKPYTAVRKVPKPVKKAQGPKVAVVPERDSDITDALIQSDIQTPRIFRPGEVIWCHLEGPIQTLGENNETIEFWPGIVDDMRLKVDTKPAPAAPQSDRMEVTEEAQDASGPSVRTSHRIRERVAHAEITWTVKQHYIYTVKLLATTHYCQLTDAEALPYLAYSLPPALVGECFSALSDLMMTIDPDKMEAQLKVDYDFNPYEPASSVSAHERMRQSVVPYTLAVEMAKNITGFWTPTDQYEYALPVPSLPPNDSINDVTSASQPSSSHVQKHSSLNAAIEAAMINNARNTTMAHISGANGISRSELKDLADNLLGKSVTDQMSQSQYSLAKTVSQVRYQGLWWGTERIWIDELVRLKLARYQFAPSGAPAVDPPAGMSASTAATVAAQGLGEIPPEAFGAGERGMFMKIDGLFVADVHTDQGTAKECRASGMIYELVDVDWQPEAKEETVQGKGKERATEDYPIDPALRLPSASQPSTPLKGVSSASNPAASTLEGGKILSSGGPAERRQYGLPMPPTGFKFNPILPAGHEVVLSLSLISGRYYPAILNHPLLINTVKEALQDEQLMNASYLWALHGSVSGIYQSMEPLNWKIDRHTMLVQSDEDARKVFATEWHNIRKQREDSEASTASQDPLPDVTMEDSFGAGPSSSSAPAVGGSSSVSVSA